MTPPEASGVAVELANLRGDLGRDLSEIKTACAVLVERSNRNEQDLRDLRTDTEADLATLRSEIEELKRNRWPLGPMAAIAGLCGTATGALALILR